MLGRIERARAQIQAEKVQRETDLQTAKNVARELEAARIAKVKQEKLEAVIDHPEFKRLYEYANGPEIRLMLKEIWDYSYSKDFTTGKEEKTIFGGTRPKKVKQRPFVIKVDHVGKREHYGSTEYDLTVGFEYDYGGSWKYPGVKTGYFYVILTIDETTGRIVLAKDGYDGDQDVGIRYWTQRFLSPDAFLDDYAREQARKNG